MRCAAVEIACRPDAQARVTVIAVVQENAGELFVNADSSTELLNDRPPLRLDAVVNFSATVSYPVTVIANHLRSLNGVNDESAGSSGWPTVGARIRAKRLKQAESLANLVQTRQTNNPAENIVLVGDFNAFPFNDGLVDSMGVTAGTPLTGLILDEDRTITLTCTQDIPIGHKVALRDLAVGDTVIKYGVDIGKVVQPVRKGQHAHVHNIKTKRW